MKYLPACILFVSCLIDLPLALTIVLLILGVILTAAALGTPNVPLVNYTVFKAADPLFALMPGSEDDDEGNESKGDFDYE